MTDQHNPDTNPNWTPLVAWRIYACDECGTEKRVQTNHTGKAWASPCAGGCRDIINPHTARERVIWHPARPHSFVRGA